MKSGPPEVICERCVLSEAFPRIRIDDQGLCDLCRDAPSATQRRAAREQLRGELSALLARTRGPRYDCLVAFSGGKDSSYTLQLLVAEYGLRCLALTIDNGFLAEQALQNCYAVTGKLEVDFQIFRPSPPFMQQMYRKSAEGAGLHARAAIKRASAICNSCINLINNCAVTTALEKQIPVVAGGYIAGQVPKDAAILRFHLDTQVQARKASLKKYQQHFGEAAQFYFGIDEALRERAGIESLQVINPLLTLSITEGEIVDAISELGWVRPVDTGSNSSNCRLNDLGIFCHHRQHGFHPYLAEIAEQVRDGLMSRSEGLERAYTVPEAGQVAAAAAKIGMKLDA